MNDENSTQSSAIARFRPGALSCQIRGMQRTAVYLQQLGFKALATISAGFAFSRGKPDGAILFGEMLSPIDEVVAATRLPVNADS